MYNQDFIFIVIIVYFSSLHNLVMFKDICKWDLLPLIQGWWQGVAFVTPPFICPVIFFSIFFLSAKRLVIMYEYSPTPYHKASSRGAYGHDPFEVFLKSIDLIPQQQILQRHYLYYRSCHCTIWSCRIKWIFFKNTSKRIMSICASGRGFTVW